MNLRHDEPLTPEEARAFLQVHAEREARTSQGARIADLAESLHLSEDEVRSILAEAKARIGTRPQKRDWAALTGILLGFGLAVALIVGLYGRPSSNGLTVPSAPSTVATQTFGSLTPSPLQSRIESPGLPAGFEISISVPEAAVRDMGPPAKFGTDFRTMGEAEAEVVRNQLVEGTLALLDDALRNSEAWMRAQGLTIHVRVMGGGWTLVKVPLKPFTLPLHGNPGGRASLKATLAALYKAGWTDVVRASPR